MFCGGGRGAAGRARWRGAGDDEPLRSIQISGRDLPGGGERVAQLKSLGWYVYLLVDPREGQVFYVGKGQGNRAYAHAADATESVDHPELQTAKHERILALHAAGDEVDVQVLRHAIDSEKQAYEVESAAIDLVNRLQPGHLLNVVLGHHHAQDGLMAADQIETLYAAPLSPEPDVPILLVSLNQVWTPTIGTKDLRRLTTQWWRAGGVAYRKPVYIMGVHHDAVRSVYRIAGWYRQQNVDVPAGESLRSDRWRFEVDDAPEMNDWLRTNVTRFLPATQWSIWYIGRPID